MNKYKKKPPRRDTPNEIELNLSKILTIITCFKMAFSGGGDWKYKDSYKKDIEEIEKYILKIWDLLPEEKINEMSKM